MTGRFGSHPALQGSEITSNRCQTHATGGGQGITKACSIAGPSHLRPVPYLCHQPLKFKAQKAAGAFRRRRSPCVHQVHGDNRRSVLHPRRAAGSDLPNPLTCRRSVSKNMCYRSLEAAFRGQKCAALAMLSTLRSAVLRSKRAV
jgi:hypothetical protein